MLFRHFAHHKKLAFGSTIILNILASTVLLTGAHAQTETLVHVFNCNGTDGCNPRGGLIADASGNLYGTTLYGGSGEGTVFELRRKTGGAWIEKILAGTDGDQPFGGVVSDASGDLYGTTEFGGDPDCGCGTVFELKPKTGGGWAQKMLHNFRNNGDGVSPNASLVRDGEGNLYGTTEGGGTYNSGTVFELKRTKTGGWAEKVLYSFTYNLDGTDGLHPFGSLIFDASGNLYGTTELGGAGCGCGIVFELSPTPDGRWAETVLHTFNGGNGANPIANLVFDTNGNLYSTTSAGGSNGEGTVFELSPTTGGGWTETVLYSFVNNGIDGGESAAGVIFDAEGNLYGNTAALGTYGGGTVFELSPTTGGGWWTEKVLYSFQQNGIDGFAPIGGMILDSSGNLYGTTLLGGTYGYGTVFEITP